MSTTLVTKKMFKILCPIERKDGATFWMRVGSAFENKDRSINLYLDVLPANLKLQVRELDEEELRERSSPGRRRGELAPGATVRALPAASGVEQESIPF